MTTALDKLRDDIADAELDARESSKASPNSYGAGYDRGFVDGMRRALLALTTESTHDK